MNRRTLLAGAGSIGLASLGGCLGTIGMASHEASPAGVTAEARSETGYKQSEIKDLTITRDVDLKVYSEEITVTNYMTKHEKSINLGLLGDQRAAVFMVLSTPQIKILGESHNPVEEMSSKELVELIENNYDKIENITGKESTSVTILDQSTTATKFTADATFNGYDVEVNLHISEAVKTDEDLVVAVGVYPRHLASQEEENIVRLMEHVVESADTESDSAGNETPQDGNRTGDNESPDNGSSNESGSRDDGILGGV